MKLISAKELDESIKRRWREVQQANPSLASPYFAPEFTEAVASVREDVFIAFDDSPDAPLFFPFQRGSLGRGRPVGGALNDCQGAIAEVGASLEPHALLALAGLNIMEFDHLVADQSDLLSRTDRKDESPRICLRDGYEGYLAERKQAGTELIGQVLRKKRKLERERGPLRFEAHSNDRAPFEKLLQWKSRQYIESGLTDVLSFPWTIQLLDRVRETNTPDFAGLLSCLYAGDDLVAVHLGMRSRTLWHYWFPAYSVDHSAYSPGLVLLFMMAESAPELGLNTIDLGKGDERYKQQLKNDSLSLAEGRIDGKGALTRLLGVREKGEAWLRRSPFFRIARVPGRLIRRLETRARFR